MLQHKAVVLCRLSFEFRHKVWSTLLLILSKNQDIDSIPSTTGEDPFVQGNLIVRDTEQVLAEFSNCV